MPNPTPRKWEDTKKKSTKAKAMATKLADVLGLGNQKAPKSQQVSTPKKPMKPRKPVVRIQGPLKPSDKKPMPATGTKRTKAPVGAAAVKELQRQVSPAGVKKKAASDLAATKKKYPGLYK